MRQSGGGSRKGKVGREVDLPQTPIVGGSLLAIIPSDASFASELAPTRSRIGRVREGRKERERASCTAQRAALKSRSAADCGGAAGQARLYISRPWRLSWTLMLLIHERLLCAKAV